MKTSRSLLLLLTCCGLSYAQGQRSEPVALPQPETPIPPAAATPTPAAPAPVEATRPALAPASAAPLAKPVGKGDILLNFQGAALTDVLNYLSEAAGFVIVQEAPVSGTVNVMSKQPISATEAVDLLNAVLIEKGFIAIRNGRILKIVNRRDAQKRDLPVEKGSDPELIPRNDEMVTQILPLRYGEAAKLIENLRPLLAENATISANESSNSILLTDTRANIRRIALIIQAVDTSVSEIGGFKIFALQFANAKDLAAVITQLFATNATGNQQGRRGFGGFPFGGGDRRGDNNTPAPSTSEAKQAAARVVAVADDQSNSLIVTAPSDVMPDIEEIVRKIDTSITDVTETRIFRLQHADATELAVILTSLHPDPGTQTNQQRRDRGGDPRQRQDSSNQQSGRALLQTKVVAVGDPRTNSLIVTAARDTMMEIAETVGRLDSTDAKKQRVYTYSLTHADADSVATVLRGMLGDQSAVTQQQQSGASRLNDRSAQGATMDTSEFSNSGGGGGGGGGRGGR